MENKIIGIEMLFKFSNEIEATNKLFVYDFNNIELEQGELAREVAEFKYNQNEAQATSISDILRSKGGEWLIIISSYLFKQKVNGDILPFDRAKSETEYDRFFRRISFAKRKLLKGAVEDFLLNMGETGIASKIFSSTNNRQNTLKLLEMITAIQSLNETNTSTNKLRSKTSSTSEN